ncbi:uncharacterized protein LOC117104507 isoform X2 [Anneissia japonica]|uniref:uncharacterized protein LOC117104507 isoform X2 n=1 Tax=Anneissia japonica TaxID=1529436 RepID=UPI001425747D|nr:uncharacterized protein LOC117104507 isoform X2 [Anneissia japonica]
MPQASILKKRASMATHYRQCYQTKKSGKLVQMKPSDRLRRNNPHPRPDFLEPKHLKEEDAKARLEDQVQQAVNEQMDRARVKEAVNNYLEKLKEEKRNVAPKIPHATFHTMPTAPPHGTGMVRSKTVTEMRPTTQTMIESEVRDNLQRMERERTSLGESAYYTEPVPNKSATRFKTCSPGPGSPAIRTRVVKRPITPTYYREHWVNWRTETPPEAGIRDKPIKWVHKPAEASRVKRVHTPPTPPPGHRDKAMAADTDRRQPRVSSAMLRHSRSKSCPPPRESPQIYRVHYHDDDDSVYGENYYSSRCESPPARPKTAGAFIANNMIEHPRIKTWMTGATDYEKEVAYNLLHTLHGGKGPDMAAKVNNNIRPRSNSASNTRRVTLPKDTSLHRAPSSPNLKSPPLDTTGVDTKSLKTWMKKIEKQIEGRAPPTERLQYSTKVDLKATQPPRHQPRIMTPEAYHNENSHFFVTGGRARGHFVIAPDWVSEGASHRRLLRQAKEAQLRRQRQQNLAISV